MTYIPQMYVVGHTTTFSEFVCALLALFLVIWSLTVVADTVLTVLIFICKVVGSCLFRQIRVWTRTIMWVLHRRRMNRRLTGALMEKNRSNQE